MKRQIPLSTAVLIALVTLMIAVAGTILSVFMIFPGVKILLGGIPQQPGMLAQKTEAIYALIEEYFLFDVEQQQLETAMFLGLTAGLDDVYAAYYTPEMMRDVSNDSQGNMVGIGVEVTAHKETGGLYINSVYENSPAYTGGLKPGDILIHAQGIDITPDTSAQAIRSIRGEEGGLVEVTVLRGETQIDFNLIRKKYEFQSVKSRMIEENGYIRITSFNQGTVEQFKHAVEELRAQGAKGLIFDLRNNGGGSLDSITEILDYLLPEGDIISATYRGGTTQVLATSDASEIDMPMVMLTNSSTASASELFVAAMKDYGKAQSVGEKTFGKGIMQSIIPLADGSGIEFTVAYFNPPSSKNFNGVGIPADYPVALTPEQLESFYTLDEHTDPQLQKAIEVLLGTQEG